MGRRQEEPALLPVSAIVKGAARKKLTWTGTTDSMQILGSVLCRNQLCTNKNKLNVDLEHVRMENPKLAVELETKPATLLPLVSAVCHSGFIPIQHTSVFAARNHPHVSWPHGLQQLRHVLCTNACCAASCPPWHHARYACHPTCSLSKQLLRY
jgi:hypothetical protein